MKVIQAAALLILVSFGVTAQKPLPCGVGPGDIRCTPTPTRPGSSTATPSPSTTPPPTPTRPGSSTATPSPSTTPPPTPTGAPPIQTGTPTAGSSWDLVVPIPNGYFSTGPDGDLLISATGKKFVAVLKQPNGKCVNVTLHVPQPAPAPLPTAVVVASR